jgi:hypothetical protein
VILNQVSIYLSNYLSLSLIYQSIYHYLTIYLSGEVIFDEVPFLIFERDYDRIDIDLDKDSLFIEISKVVKDWYILDETCSPLIIDLYR